MRLTCFVLLIVFLSLTGYSQEFSSRVSVVEPPRSFDWKEVAAAIAAISTVFLLIVKYGLQPNMKTMMREENDALYEKIEGKFVSLERFSALERACGVFQRDVNRRFGWKRQQDDGDDEQ